MIRIIQEATTDPSTNQSMGFEDLQQACARLGEVVRTRCHNDKITKRGEAFIDNMTALMTNLRYDLQPETFDDLVRATDSLATALIDLTEIDPKNYPGVDWMTDVSQQPPLDAAFLQELLFANFGSKEGIVKKIKGIPGHQTGALKRLSDTQDKSLRQCVMRGETAHMKLPEAVTDIEKLIWDRLAERPAPKGNGAFDASGKYERFIAYLLATSTTPAYITPSPDVSWGRYGVEVKNDSGSGGFSLVVFPKVNESVDNTWFDKSGHLSDDAKGRVELEYFGGDPKNPSKDFRIAIIKHNSDIYLFSRKTGSKELLDRCACKRQRIDKDNAIVLSCKLVNVEGL